MIGLQYRFKFVTNDSASHFAAMEAYPDGIVVDISSSSIVMVSAVAKRMYLRPNLTGNSAKYKSGASQSVSVTESDDVHPEPSSSSEAVYRAEERPMMIFYIYCPVFTFLLFFFWKSPTAGQPSTSDLRTEVPSRIKGP